MMKRNDKVIVLYNKGNYEVKDMHKWRGNEEDLKDVLLFLIPFFGKDPLYIPIRPSKYLFGTSYEVVLCPRMFLVEVDNRDIIHDPMKEEQKTFEGTDLGIVEFVNYLYSVYKIETFADIMTMWDLPDEYGIGIFYDVFKLGIRIWKGEKELYNKVQTTDILTYEEFEIDGYVVSLDSYRLMMEFLIINLAEMLNDVEFPPQLYTYTGKKKEKKQHNLIELFQDRYNTVKKATLYGTPYLYPIIGLNAFYLTTVEELDFLAALEIPSSFLIYTFASYRSFTKRERSCFSSQEDLSDGVSELSYMQIHSLSPTKEYHYIYLGCFLPYYCEYLRAATAQLLFEREETPDQYPVVVAISNQYNNNRIAYLDKQVQSFQQLKPILQHVLGGASDDTETI